tara:strand:+ start:31 stop:531 length:501 start_codon:yes stop_codon:yes gene_type:complete
LRNIFLLIIIVNLANCGFRPLYEINEKILDYKITTIVKVHENNKNSKKEALIIKKYLNERLNRTSSKSSNFKLIIALKRSQVNLGLQKDLSTTKYMISYTAEYKFFDKKGSITSGTVEKLSSFDLGESSYANLVAQESTNRNILKALAQEIVNLVLATNPKRKLYP